jgi:hypothetical protein
MLNRSSLMNQATMVVAVVGSLAAPSPSAANGNEGTTIVLHAEPIESGCDLQDPCAAGARVVVDRGGVLQAIFVFVRNYDNLRLVQFDVVASDGWMIVAPLDCRVNCLDCVISIDDRVHWNAVFDCVVGGATEVLGRILVIPNSGCIEVVESTLYGGTMVADCDWATVAIPPSHWGRVCVGAGGVDACETPSPVEPATWGRIKRQYGQR